MSYSEEEIQKYLNILKSFNERYDNIDYFAKPLKSNKVSCDNCNNTHFIYDKGYRYCNKCGLLIGHILSYNDLSEIDRCHFYQKTIYKRRYHYQNKIEEVNTKFNLNLSSDEKYELLKKLRKIGNEVIKK